MTPRRRSALLLAVAFIVLYAISIPWYRPTGALPAIWFGLPDWVVVATLAHVLVAALCSIVWLRRAREEDS